MKTQLLSNCIQLFFLCLKVSIKFSFTHALKLLYNVLVRLYLEFNSIVWYLNYKKYIQCIKQF